MTKPTKEQIEAALEDIRLCKKEMLGLALLTDDTETTILAALEAYKPVDVEELKVEVRNYLSDKHLAEPSIEWTIDHLVEKGIINGK